MPIAAVKLGQGEYARDYCLIDEPEADGGGVEFWVNVQCDDVEPRGRLARLLRRVADWILNGGL